MIRLTVTDGGKIAEGFTDETNDCAVRALAIAADIPYAKAHHALKAKGRRDRRGTKLSWISQAIKEQTEHTDEIIPSTVSPCGTRLRVSYPNLTDTLRKYPTGRYLIVVTGHAIAVIDGVVYDAASIKGGRSRVRRIFRVVPRTKEVPVNQIISQDQINELWARLDKLEGKAARQ